jgi:lysophospholipase L1-like esterase
VKRFGTRLILLVVATLLAVVLVEQALRAIGYEYRPVSVDVHDTEDARYYHLFGSDHFVYDPDLIWKPQPDHQVFNSQGFRGPLMAGKKRDVVRIVAIGDSNTLGWATPNGANWPLEVGRLLRETGRAVEVINAGVWGYSSLQGLRRFEQVLEHRPDVVLISFGSNDAHRVRRPDREFAGRSSRFRDWERWFTHYRLGQLTTAALQALGGGSGELQPRVGLDEYRRHLRQMAELGRSEGVQVVFLTRPFEFEISDPLWWKNFGYDYNAATAEVAAAERVPLIDLYSFFKGRRGYFADESHFTAEGHGVAAQIVVTHLEPIVAQLSSGG